MLLAWIFSFMMHAEIQADESGVTVSIEKSGGEGDASEGGTSTRLHAPPRARRTPRAPAPAIMRSGGRVRARHMLAARQQANH